MDMALDHEMYVKTALELGGREITKNILSWVLCRYNDDNSHNDTFKVLNEDTSSVLSNIPLKKAIIACSFESRRHAEYHELKKTVDDWIRLRFANVDKKIIDKIILSDVPNFTSLVYATALPKYRLSAIAKFSVWVIMFDDIIDKPRYRGANLDTADTLICVVSDIIIRHVNLGMYQSTIEALLRAAGISSGAFSPLPVDLHGEGVGHADEMAKALIEMAVDWASEIFASDMPPYQQIRFVRGTFDYFHASRQQIVYRATDALPGFDTFNHFRILDSSVFAANYVLLEYGLGIELDEQTRCHPLLRQLLSNASSQICAVNDLLSFRRESQEGDLMSIVPLLYFHKLGTARHAGKISCIVNDINFAGGGGNHCLEEHTSEADLLENVLSEVSYIIAEHDRECVRLLKLINECPVLMAKPGLSAYLQGISDWISGSHEWHLLSHRYKDSRPDQSMLK